MKKFFFFSFSISIILGSLSVEAMSDRKGKTRLWRSEGSARPQLALPQSVDSDAKSEDTSAMSQAKPEKGKRWIERSEGSARPQLALSRPVDSDAKSGDEGIASSAKRSRCDDDDPLRQSLLREDSLGLSGEFLKFDSYQKPSEKVSIGEFSKGLKRSAQDAPSVDGGAGSPSKRLAPCDDKDSFKLSVLPEELLVAIFKRLDLPALSKISQTSKRLNSISHDKFVVDDVLANSVENPSLIGKYLLEIVKKKDIELLKYHFEKNKKALNNVDLKDLLLLSTQEGFENILNFIWENMTQLNKDTSKKSYWLESIKNKNLKLVKKICNKDYEFSIFDDEDLVFMGIYTAIRFEADDVLGFLLNKIKPSSISVQRKVELLFLLLVQDRTNDLIYLKKFLKKCSRQFFDNFWYMRYSISKENFLLREFLETVHEKDKLIPQDAFFYYENNFLNGSGKSAHLDPISMILSRASERSIIALFEYCDKIEARIPSIGYYWYYKAISEDNRHLIEALMRSSDYDERGDIEKAFNLAFKFRNDFALKCLLNNCSSYLGNLVEVFLCGTLKLDSLDDVKYFVQVLEKSNLENKDIICYPGGIVDLAFSHSWADEKSKKKVLFFLLEKALAAGYFENFFYLAAKNKNIEFLDILFDKSNSTQEIIDSVFCKIVDLNDVEILEYFVKNKKYPIKTEIFKRVFMDSPAILDSVVSMEYLSHFFDPKEVDLRISQLIEKLVNNRHCFIQSFKNVGSSDKFLVFKKLFDMASDGDDTFIKLCDFFNENYDDFNKDLLLYIKDILGNERVKNDKSIRTVFHNMINRENKGIERMRRHKKKVVATLREYFFLLCSKDNPTDKDITRMCFMYKLQHKNNQLIGDNDVKLFMFNFGKTGTLVTLNNLLRNLNKIRCYKQKVITNELLKEILNGAIDGENIALIRYIFSKKLLGDEEIEVAFYRAVRENKYKLADGILLIKSPCPITYDKISACYMAVMGDESDDSSEYCQKKLGSLNYLQSVLDFVDHVSGSAEELETQWQSYIRVIFDQKNYPDSDSDSSHSLSQSEDDEGFSDSDSDSGRSLSQSEDDEGLDAKRQSVSLDGYDSDESAKSSVKAKYGPRHFYSSEQDVCAQLAFLRANPGYRGDGYDRGDNGAGPAE